MRQFSPAAERNCEAILAVLRYLMPDKGTVLEIAAGTGQHAAYFARHLPLLTWQPSDTSAMALESIAAWRDWSELANLRPPLELDVTALPWPVDEAAGVFCANLLHISPWNVCEALFAGASILLLSGAPLMIYGPFFRDDAPTAASNQTFDRSLRERDASWGIRQLEDVERVAKGTGFVLDQLTEMPANNLMLAFRRVSHQTSRK